jgi:hypothetical protein
MRTHPARAPRALLAAVLALAGTGSAHAAFKVIDFDADAAGAPIAPGALIGEQYAAWGVHFAPTAFPAGAASGSGTSQTPLPVWASNTGMHTAAVNGSDVGAGAAGAGNLLHSFTDYLGEDGDPSFVITFDRPVSSLSILYSGIGEGGWTGFKAFRGTTELVDLRVQSPTIAGPVQSLSISAVGDITRVLVMPGSYDDWVGVDNIEIDVALPAPGAGLALLAVPLVGGRRRRR